MDFLKLFSKNLSNVDFFENVLERNKFLLKYFFEGKDDDPKKSKHFSKKNISFFKSTSFCSYDFFKEIYVNWSSEKCFLKNLSPGPLVLWRKKLRNSL